MKLDEPFKIKAITIGGHRMWGLYKGMERVEAWFRNVGERDEISKGDVEVLANALIKSKQV